MPVCRYPLVTRTAKGVNTPLADLSESGDRCVFTTIPKRGTVVNCAESAAFPPENPLAHSSQTMPSDRSSSSAPDSVAFDVLRRFRGCCTPQRLISVRAAGGFSGARLWRVASREGDCALRAMRKERVDLARLQGLHRLLHHIASAGVEQSPVPFPTDAATTYVLDADCFWQLEPWRPGSADRTAAPSHGRLRSALRLLARWHCAAQTFATQALESPWFAVSDGARSPGIAERLERIARFNEAACAHIRQRLLGGDWPEFDDCGLRVLELYRQQAARIAGELESAWGLAVPLQPCLRDVWREHVLFVEDEATGLIDAHACRSENVATDIARLLGSFSADDRALWEIGLTAYTEVRPLTLDERGLVELFDRSSVLLSGLTWLQWRVLEGRRFDDPVAVVERLRGILARLERLGESARRS